MLEIGEKLHIDRHKLWQEYIGYKSFIESLPNPVCLETAIHVMYSPANREAMALAYPLISSILAWIAVLPASSAQVERLFSAMKRIKSSQRNRLKSTTLDHLMRISIEGPLVHRSISGTHILLLENGNQWEIEEYRSLVSSLMTLN